ncbi:hypothetical protein ACFPIJ_29245 [Dactylosporangium cerinum]|uniref:Uncharacterized protein n=1 Tax=Dactylosporangium cerinum TaxID=1434730 RepID=A0ABV9W235_9ACTN
MTELTADYWRRMYRPVLDARAGEPEDALDIPPDTQLPGLIRVLRPWYREHPGVDRVTIRVKGADVGVTTRAKVMKDWGHLGEDPSAAVGPGAGDGATLPGFPAEFRAIRYTCGERGCDRTMLRIFYDERDVPQCAEHPAIRMVYSP